MRMPRWNMSRAIGNFEGTRGETDAADTGRLEKKSSQKETRCRIEHSTIAKRDRCEWKETAKVEESAEARARSFRALAHWPPVEIARPSVGRRPGHPARRRA